MEAPQLSMIEWRKTNESLDSVVNGLAVNQDDLILSAGGSGDQGFAMIARGAKKVTLYDFSEAQIEYINGQMGCLRRGHFLQFLQNRYYMEGMHAENLSDALVFEKYSGNRFFNLDVMKKLKARLREENPLEVRKMHLREALTSVRFGKLHLSNCISFGIDTVAPRPTRICAPMITSVLADVAKSLPAGGLVYLSDGEFCLKYLKELPKEFEQDAALTAAARAHEAVGWAPLVLRRKNE